MTKRGCISEVFEKGHSPSVKVSFRQLTDWQINWLTDLPTDCLWTDRLGRETHLMEGGPASSCGARSWPPAAAPPPRRRVGRMSWTGAPGGTPSGPPEEASASALIKQTQESANCDFFLLINMQTKSIDILTQITMAATLTVWHCHVDMIFSVRKPLKEYNFVVTDTPLLLARKSFSIWSETFN